MDATAHTIYEFKRSTKTSLIVPIGPSSGVEEYDARGIKCYYGIYYDADRQSLYASVAFDRLLDMCMGAGSHMSLTKVGEMPWQTLSQLVGEARTTDTGLMGEVQMRHTVECCK